MVDRGLAVEGRGLEGRGGIESWRARGRRGWDHRWGREQGAVLGREGRGGAAEPPRLPARPHPADYHRCVKRMNRRGKSTQPCQYYFRVFHSLCPMSWVSRPRGRRRPAGRGEGGGSLVAEPAPSASPPATPPPPRCSAGPNRSRTGPSRAKSDGLSAAPPKDQCSDRTSWRLAETRPRLSTPQSVSHQ